VAQPHIAYPRPPTEKPRTPSRHVFGRRREGGRRRRARSLRYRLIAGLVKFLVVPLLVLLLAGSWEAADLGLHPPRFDTRHTLRDFPALDAVEQDVSFPSRAGRVRLVGRFFPSRSRAAIILSHGFGPDQDQMLPWADFLHRAGYSVLTFDMRARGGSGGAAVTLGALEPYDLLGAVDYVASRRDVDRRRIGALGLSLGAAVTIMAAARDDRIRAVVDDSSFSDAQSAIGSAFGAFTHLPSMPFALPTVAIAEWRAGVSLATVRPVAVVGRISPRPILIIHGLADTFIPPVNSQRIYAAAGRPKSVWWVPGAGHTGAYAVERAVYERRVVAFFRHALR